MSRWYQLVHVPVYQLVHVPVIGACPGGRQKSEESGLKHTIQSPGHRFGDQLVLVQVESWNRCGFFACVFLFFVFLCPNEKLK